VYLKCVNHSRVTQIVNPSDASSFKQKTEQRVTESDSYFDSWKRIFNAKVGFRWLYGYTTVLKLISYFIFRRIRLWFTHLRYTTMDNLFEEYDYGLHIWRIRLWFTHLKNTTIVYAFEEYYYDLRIWVTRLSAVKVAIWFCNSLFCLVLEWGGVWGHSGLNIKNKIININNEKRNQNILKNLDQSIFVAMGFILCMYYNYNMLSVSILTWVLSKVPACLFIHSRLYNSNVHFIYNIIICAFLALITPVVI
jgi:hypothetical protein